MYGLNRLRKKLNAEGNGRVGTGFSPYINPAELFGLKALRYALLICSAKNRTSGPKGHEDDNVYAGDKSPAYPEDEFFCSLFRPSI
jgi:hypothetical protein